MEYIVWGVGFGPLPPELIGADAPDNEDWQQACKVDPGFGSGAWDTAETINDPRWIMIVDSRDVDISALEVLRDEGKIRGFTPRVQPVRVWDAESSDGRWGLEVYAPSAEVVQKMDGIFSAPGFAAEVRGEVAGRKIIFLTPFANTTVVWGDGLEAESGADEVLSMDLQYRQVTVCNCEPGAQLREYGYKHMWDVDRTLVIDPAGRLRAG
jgi:hypothetical protein